MSYKTDRENLILLFFFGIIISDHLIKCILSWLSLSPMMLLFGFELFVQNIKFYIKEADLSITLELKKKILNSIHCNMVSELKTFQ